MKTSFAGTRESSEKGGSTTKRRDGQFISIGYIRKRLGNPKAISLSGTPPTEISGDKSKKKKG